ncbi:hypothetical protein C5Y93_26240 [Blastopirellula marina]|uniref:HEAT repeat domain-containing protein n=1 Tax=Blastopirellula marina TaxID=124 RepID=A0A2S8GFJ7_9BACT|nr:hypothetical protein C5Y93_26240 [Blastopirellula marina]
MHPSCRTLAILPVLLLLAQTQGAEPATTSPALRCETILVESSHAEGEWSGIHAAEYLIRLNESPKALAAFRPLAECMTPQYRIGVWRVLAQAEPAPQDKARYIEKIRSVLLDDTADDRLHALESLAKLHVSIEAPGELEIVERLADSADYPGRSFAIWRLMQAKPTPKLLDLLMDELKTEDDVRRLRAAFVLGQWKPLPAADQAKLRQLSASEPLESIVFPYLAIAAGQGETKRLAESKNAAHRALALKELTIEGSAVKVDPAVDLADDAPLALRQAASFALLMKRPNETADAN